MPSIDVLISSALELASVPDGSRVPYGSPLEEGSGAEDVITTLDDGTA
jgi:hypothetical protein